MKPTGRLLYSSMDRREAKRWFIIPGVLVAFLSAVMVVIADFVFIRLGRPLFAVIVTVLFAWGIPYTLHILVTKSLRVSEHGITIPTPFSGFFPKFVPFPKISEIRLVTEQGRPSTHIQIHTRDGKLVRYPRSLLPNWDEFYKVLTEDLKGKVKIVE